MYTSLIGRKFVEINNKRNNINLSVKDFFEKELFPLFYDHSKYLHSPANTPLFQVIAQKKTKSPSARAKAYSEIVEKIASFEKLKGNKPDMSFAIGYPSADYMGTTSGQITSLDLPLVADDMYASWIGAGFGIGFAGGLNVFIENSEVLEAISEGWKLYRQFVDENTGIENKIDTWNGLWLIHRLSETYNPKTPRANFQPVQPGKDGLAKMERPSWTQLLFCLSKLLPKQKLNAYVCYFGQTNKTVGFIRFELPEVKILSDYYMDLFGKNAIVRNQKLAEIYESEYGFSAVCERFSLIGLRAFEPKDLRKFMPNYSDFNELPKFKNDDKSIINYSIYITWVAAMLNNKSLLELAEQAAEMLQAYSKSGKRATTERSNTVKELLNSRTRKELIGILSQIVEEEPTTASVCNHLVQSVMIDIPAENVQLFITLIRFNYAKPNIRTK